ncbi:MAG TPA: hypothetical protein VIP70_11655 [Nitrososphaeraceae archaeon]
MNLSKEDIHTIYIFETKESLLRAMTKKKHNHHHHPLLLLEAQL